MRVNSAVFMWLLAGLAAALGQAKVPSINFDSTGMDAGKVTQGETIKQRFAFTNKGGATLEIKGLEPS